MVGHLIKLFFQSQNFHFIIATTTTKCIKSHCPSFFFLLAEICLHYRKCSHQTEKECFQKTKKNVWIMKLPCCREYFCSMSKRQCRGSSQNTVTLIITTQTVSEGLYFSVF